MLSKQINIKNLKFFNSTEISRIKVKRMGKITGSLKTNFSKNNLASLKKLIAFVESYVILIF